MSRSRSLLLVLVLAVAAQTGPASAQFSFFGLSADVTMVIAPLARANKAAVTVDIVAKENFDARRIYVELRCNEIVEIENYNVPADKNLAARTIRVKSESRIAEREYTLVTSQKYTKGQNATVKGEIEIPANFPPSYNGKLARVRCEARAGVDIPGNDPNSPWQEVILH